MKQLITILAGIACLVAGETLTAGTDLKISGQVRYRNELNKKPRDDHWSNIEYLRSRVAFNATVDSSTTAFVQFQDSRFFGDYNVPPTISSTTEYKSNADVHQAYIETKLPIPVPSTARVGRFEFKVGNERIIGVDDWDNVGRSFNGVQIVLSPKVGRLTCFTLYGAQVQETNWWRDQKLWGFTIQPEAVNLNLLFFYDRYWEGYETDGWGLRANTYLTKRYNLVAYGSLGPSALTANFVGAYQIGTYDTGLANLINGTQLYSHRRNIEAYMLSVEVVARLQTQPVLQLSAGVDYTPGEDTSSTTVDLYNFAFFSSHLFRGNMGYFSRWVEYGGKGLIDFFTRVHYEPWNKWSTQFAAHIFASDKDLGMPGWIPNYPGRTLGTELDLSVSSFVVKGLELESGMSVFFPTERFARRKNPDPGLWGYLMSTVDF